MRVLMIGLILCSAALPVRAQEALGLSAPPEVTETGFLKYLLPRFSLKTGIRVQPSPDGAMALASDGTGEPVFRQGDVTYRLTIDEDPKQARFLDWLTSDIGKRTIDSFQIDGAAVFSSKVAVTVVEEAAAFTGDAALGETLALTHCGRCHVVGDQNRQNGIGSTPSFAVLRSLPDWGDRFQQFYVLRPHAAFTQIRDVTEPFAPELPSPIYPVEMTLEDLDAILAFVEATKAADLGKPIQFQ